MAVPVAMFLIGMSVAIAVGAGVIVKAHHDRQITGLTSAANIWLTASIGMACGLGREASAIVVTALALLILAALPKLEEKMAEPGRASCRDDRTDGR